MASSEANVIAGHSCPCCDSEAMNITRTEYNADHFGSVLLSVTICQKCGYKHADVSSLESRDPILVSARIRSIIDLEIKVIKSGTATIKIPEFGATITPGPYGEGFITNVEGVLKKVEDALTFMLSSADEKNLKKGEKILKEIKLSRESKPHFTIIIEDPLGNSDLVSPNPSKIERCKLTKRELQTEVRSIRS